MWEDERKNNLKVYILEGICGSDIPRIFRTGTYHFPTIPGHEFAGVVHRAGQSGISIWSEREWVYFR